MSKLTMEQNILVEKTVESHYWVISVESEDTVLIDKEFEIVEDAVTELKGMANGNYTIDMFIRDLDDPYTMSIPVMVIDGQVIMDTEFRY